MTSPQPSDGKTDAGITVLRNTFSPVRLILIPLLIYTAWVIDTFLMEGNGEIFTRYQPFPFLMYSVVANIFMGTVIPVLCLKSAFFSGAVNMFQVGFRNPRRTLSAVTVTALAGSLVLVTFTAYGSKRLTLLLMTAFLLPTAIAGVTVCWVLIGTHLQAYIRSYGATVSIILGVLVTGLLFGLSFAAHSPPLNLVPFLTMGIFIGVASAVFFFSVRDVYASALFLAYGLAYVLQGIVDPRYVQDISLPVLGSAALAVLALAGCQCYLQRQFITVRIPMNT